MNRLLMSAVLLVSPAMANDISVLDELKSTPLTSYEAGRNQLATFASAINLFTKLEGKQEFSFNVIEDDSRLGVEISGFMPVRKVTQKECNAGFTKLSALNIVPDLPTLVWPNLSPSQVKSIQDELFIQVTIVAKENHEFSVSCRKTLAEI
ncbi:hypothetical protein ACVTP5_002927 [Vibrio parahaemolyticus]|uniref:hypothetical protein n=1 Tax=Vibrio parahaemolyticus TaxID=670 RepID=UPI00111F7918|nr:hypothetical protein [Vibrio parahaemolyticus]EJI1394783.1 hypothetical protein [Vibrio parahaemolyticus]EJL7824589.1 hypothetical protein [Vibrio parahaemolyticus]EJM7150451.1 hypothetical protein [Vibrio parahaemolyticus]EME0896116.1 hypothetical protein [Vibrio parahaemolyticus]MBE3910775.1 hypothetical protein [Vibrio parahaemolyticus]